MSKLILLLSADLDVQAAFEYCYRRLLVAHFPYGIFYTIEARGIIVVGIIDTRRDPEAILQCLR